MPFASEAYAIADLISLAQKKGYALDAAGLPDKWRLIGNNLRAALAPDGTAYFTTAEAKALLLTLPDA